MLSLITEEGSSCRTKSFFQHAAGKHRPLNAFPHKFSKASNLASGTERQAASVKGTIQPERNTHGCLGQTLLAGLNAPPAPATSTLHTLPWTSLTACHVLLMWQGATSLDVSQGHIHLYPKPPTPQHRAGAQSISLGSSYQA